MNERWRMRRTTRRQLIAGGVAVIAPLGLGTLWPVRYHGRLYPGVVVAGLDLGGLTPAAATARLEDALARFLARPVTFRLDDRRWAASAADLGIRLDLETTFDRACRHGRGDGILRRYATLLDPEDARTGVPMVITLDSTILRAFLDGLDRDISLAARDAKLVLHRAEITVAPARAGRRLDDTAMHDQVLAAAATLTPTELPVVTRRTEPRITAADLADARSVAATLLGAPVTITHDDRSWTIASAQLAAALVLPDDSVQALPTLSHDALIAQLAPIADEVNQAPQDATVAWDGGLYATDENVPGAEVDLAALAAAVAAAALTEDRRVELPIISIAPTVDADDLAALGITRPLATGSSSFAGSSEARATNVRVAADHVSQTLIPPGGTFSFNSALGPITLDHGYVEGKVISGDWFADDLGGGVCQVSTTVHRAALLAGLPFAEWHPHSFRLAFYELDGWPPGIDAAIYQPNMPDEWELNLVFTNPTDAWMLLQLRVNGKTVAAELYGRRTDYDVAISDPVLGDPIPPPAPIERESAELGAGEREQIQTAQPGLTVRVTRTVQQYGELVSEEVFVSAYEPQREVWLVGSANA